jgi:hypothetical protein
MGGPLSQSEHGDEEKIPAPSGTEPGHTACDKCYHIYLQNCPAFLYNLFTLKQGWGNYTVRKQYAFVVSKHSKLISLVTCSTTNAGSQQIRKARRK